MPPPSDSDAEVTHERPLPVIEVEVVYAAPQRSVRRAFCLSVPATVADALARAAADAAFGGLSFEHGAVGVFGRVAAPGQSLEQGDRVEIYRPLAADPKTARRARAREARKNSAGID